MSDVFLKGLDDDGTVYPSTPHTERMARLAVDGCFVANMDTVKVHRMRQVDGVVSFTVIKPDGWGVDFAFNVSDLRHSSAAALTQQIAARMVKPEPDMLIKVSEDTAVELYKDEETYRAWRELGEAIAHEAALEVAYYKQFGQLPDWATAVEVIEEVNDSLIIVQRDPDSTQ